eukprot:2528862-Pyramimonas_sp.AAC.1
MEGGGGWPPRGPLDCLVFKKILMDPRRLQETPKAPRRSRIRRRQDHPGGPCQVILSASDSESSRSRLGWVFGPHWVHLTALGRALGSTMEHHGYITYHPSFYQLQTERNLFAQLCTISNRRNILPSIADASVSWGNTREGL